MAAIVARTERSCTCFGSTPSVMRWGSRRGRLGTVGTVGSAPSVMRWGAGGGMLGTVALPSRHWWS
ncbi:hypothetical protein GCM10023168_31110 [Fodinibacter luteus]|uniref:Uncharacterized protein n=1 Tax=Fodinibacter luteus TaxID=552064 RepID=A0ABP8KNA5_9MICO